MKRPADPYDFEDDVMVNNGSLDPFKIKEEKEDLKAPNSVKSQTDPMSPSKKLGNLYTHEGLVPKASDLDDIFDCPIEDVSSELFRNFFFPLRILNGGGNWPVIDGGVNGLRVSHQQVGVR